MPTESPSSQPYAHPPIVEAVIDVRVETPTTATLSDLERFCELERDRYPKQEGRFEVEGKLAWQGDVVSTAANRRQIGFVLTSTDATQVVQATIQGLTFSRLTPYEGWDAFEGEASRLWQVFREELQPIGLERLGVRYINRLDLDSWNVSVDEYFKTYPEIAEGIPPHLAGYFLQLQIPLLAYDSHLTMTQTTVSDSSQPGISLILDNDVFRLLDVPIDIETVDAQLREWLANMRQAKNEIFESCITEKTRELIK